MKIEENLQLDRTKAKKKNKEMVLFFVKKNDQ